MRRECPSGVLGWSGRVPTRFSRCVVSPEPGAREIESGDRLLELMMIARAVKLDGLGESVRIEEREVRDGRDAVIQRERLIARNSKSRSFVQGSHHRGVQRATAV